MRVWLDDLRPMPACFDQHAKTAQEAIHLLSTQRVTHISFDHDLGPAEAGTGYAVACWIEEQVEMNPEYLPPTWAVHSANPIGRRRIEQALRRLVDR